MQPTALDRCVALWRNTWRIRWRRSSCEGTSSRATRWTCTRLVNNWRSRWLEAEQGEPEKLESTEKCGSSCRAPLLLRLAFASSIFAFGRVDADFFAGSDEERDHDFQATI